MEIRYKKGELLYLVLAFLLIFYCYNTTFERSLYGSKMNGILLVCIITFFCFLKNFSVKKIQSANKILIAWELLALLSLIGNQDLINDSESRWLLPMVGIVALISLSKNKSWINYFIVVSKFFVLFHSFFTIFFYIFKSLYLRVFINLIPGDHTYLISKFNEGSMPGITGHYSTNGIYLGFGLIFFAIDLMFKKRKNSQEIIHDGIKFLIVFLALILTTKRAHIMFGILAIFIMYYVYNSNKKITRWFYIVFALIFLGVFIVIASQFIPAIANIINRFLYADGGELTNGRIWFWKFAITKFRENPLIGIGWGGFKHEFYKIIGPYSSTSDWVDCHCVFLQVLCEQGILGEILFLIATIGGIGLNWKYLKKGRKNQIIISCAEIRILTLTLGLQAFFIMYCVTGNCLYDCEAFFPYILACAASLYNINIISKRNRN